MRTLCGLLLFTFLTTTHADPSGDYPGRIEHVEPPASHAKVYDSWIGKLPAQLKYAWGDPDDEYASEGYSYIRYSLPRGIDCHTVFQVDRKAPRVITAWRQYGTACPAKR